MVVTTFGVILSLRLVNYLLERNKSAASRNRVRNQGAEKLQDRRLHTLS